MEKKKIGYILIIVSLLIILLGTIFFLIDSNKKQNKAKDEKKTAEEIIELEKNDSLKEEHCLENICLKNMVVTGNYNEYYTASVDVTNKSTQTVENKYIKVLFNVNGKTHIEYIYIDSLLPNKTTLIDTGLSDNTLLEATSYQLENPTEKEIAEQEALLVD